MSTASLKLTTLALGAVIVLSSCSTVNDAVSSTTREVAEAVEEKAAEKSGMPSATTVVNSLQKEFNGLQSVTMHMTGELEEGMQELTISGFRDSTDMAMEVVMENGGKGSVLQIGDTMYTKGDDLFWKASMGAVYTPAIAKRINGKYVVNKLTEKEKKAAKSVVQEMVEEADLSEVGFLTKMATTMEKTTHEGKPALKLIDPGTQGTYVIVSAEEPHTPFVVEAPLSATSQKNTLSVFKDWNSVAPLKAPPAAEQFTP